MRVRLAGICNTDLELVRGYYPFAGVPGHEFVGRVEEAPGGARVGRPPRRRRDQCRLRRVRDLPRGTPHATASAARVLGIVGRDGAFATHLRCRSQNLHAVPDALPDEAAVFTEPLAAALEIQEQVRVGAGRSRRRGRRGQARPPGGPDPGADGCGSMSSAAARRPLELLAARGIAVGRPSALEPRTADVVVECTGNPTASRSRAAPCAPAARSCSRAPTTAGRRSTSRAVVVDEITLVGSRCGPFAPGPRAPRRPAAWIRARSSTPATRWRKASPPSSTPRRPGVAEGAGRLLTQALVERFALATPRARPRSSCAGQPRSVQPANGVLRPLLAKRAGFHAHGAPSRSSTVTSAGERRARACRRAGPKHARAASSRGASTSRARGRRDLAATSRSRHSATAVSRPTMPNAAWSYSTFLSSRCAARGRWRCSRWCRRAGPRAPPAGRPPRAAAGSSWWRCRTRCPCTASSVSSRWCGVASAVTRTPRALPRRTASTERRALETWAMCTLAAGQLGQQHVALDHDRLAAPRARRAGPSSVDTGPSFMRRLLGERRLLAVVDDREAEGLRVLERAPHHARARHRPAVVGDGDAAGLAQVAVLGQLLALRAAGDGADRVDAHGALGARPLQDRARDAGACR